MFNKIFYKLCIFYIGTIISLAHAQENIKSAKLNNNAAIAQIQTYLNNLTTLTANFTQILPEGELSTGMFYLARPGKLRWEYDAPNPILITVNNNVLTYYDRELDQINYTSANDHLISILTRKNINLIDSDIKIKQIEKTAGIIKISFNKKEHEKEGFVTLSFDTAPFSLKQINIEDSANQITTITLDKAKYGNTLSKDLFYIKPPNRK